VRGPTAKQKWGPALLPSPTAPSMRLPVFASCRKLHPEGKGFSHPRSLSTRSGVASVSIGCPVSRALPRGFRPGPALRPFHRVHPALPALSGSNERRSEDLCSFTVRLRRSWSSPPLRIRCVPKNAATFQASVSVLDLLLSLSLASQFQCKVATNRPFAALLGIIVFRAALTTPRKGDPACGGETIISSGASCRLRFEDPPVAPVRHPGEARPSKPNSTSSPCRRRSEVRSLSCRLTLAGLLEERAGCPRSPDEDDSFRESRKAKSGAPRLWITGISGLKVSAHAVAVPFSPSYLLERVRIRCSGTRGFGVWDKSFWSTAFLANS
jgi:hypothetical protein